MKKILNLNMENWMRDPRKFQLVSGPRGKYVYHRSPSGRKVTRNVPLNIMTKQNAVRYFRTAPHAPARAARTLWGGIPAAQPLGCNSLKNLTGLKKIGSGRQGVIYAATRQKHHIIRDIAIKVVPHDLLADRRKEKQPARVEYDIMNSVRTVAHGGIILPLKFAECHNFVPASNMRNVNRNPANYDAHHQYVIFMERADGGNIRDWLAKPGRTDAEVTKALVKVLETLVDIMKAHPEFRHNDMHLENVLMMKGVPKIADFGWARLQKRGTNPAVNTALANGTAAKFGIGPDTDQRYDAHLFLNEIRRFITRQGMFPKVRAKLEACLPVGYREFTDTYTSEGRLKYGMSFPDLPSVEDCLQILKKQSPARRVSPPRAPVVVAHKLPSPPRRNSYTNAELIALPAANFLKLTPKTRARALALRKGVKGKSPARLKLNKAKNNATARKKASPLRAVSRSNVRLSPRVLRSNQFNRFVAGLLKLNEHTNYQSAWNAARANAIRRLENRIRAGKPAFSPTSPGSVVRSAGSGRYKVKGPSGRLVYADGASVTMNFLKNLASRKGVVTTGLRSKEAIAKAIFNHK
jgi:serine/threonine protein kinase